MWATVLQYSFSERKKCRKKNKQKEAPSPISDVIDPNNVTSPVSKEAREEPPPMMVDRKCPACEVGVLQPANAVE